MYIFVIGQPGSDAGYTYLGPDGQWHHVGGWGVESIAEVSRALSILGTASRLKTPDLADSLSKNLMGLVQKELETHLGDKLKQGAVVVINASV
jgi:hypothetical protein